MRAPLLTLVPAAVLVTSNALAADPPPPPHGPPTSEPPTVAPASDPFHASPVTLQGTSLTQPPSPTRTFPSVGGHMGLALPVFSMGRVNRFIGSDFFTLGMTPGITVHFDDLWAIDFEFIALDEFKSPAHTVTTFVVDPGIIRKFDGFNLGLRWATQVGAPTNMGLVPIAVLPFKLGQRTVWFAELDLPLFVRDNGIRPEFSFNAQLQTGIGF